MTWAFRTVLAFSIACAAILSYLHGQRIQHLTARITQASAQVAVLETLGSSLHNELLKAILEPDVDKATEALSQFERDAMHALGALEQMTETEVDFVQDEERAEEAAELMRPAHLRDATVKTLVAARRLIKVRQSADIMPDATVLLEHMEVERTTLSHMVSDIQLDERTEIRTATDRISSAQKELGFRLSLLITLAALSGIAALVTTRRQRLHADNRRNRALIAMIEQGSIAPPDAHDPLSPALARVANHIKSVSDAKAATERELENRTAALQLSASKLKQIDETRRRFLADLGHSLKTPLAIARGSVEALPDGGAKRLAALEAIDQVTRRVSDLLQLSRSDDGRLLRKNQLLELTELLDNRVAELSALPQGEHITLTTDGDGPYEIEGDREALTRMFDAIIENGLRYAGPDAPLSISIDTIEKSVRVSIVDQGPGVSQGNVVFDRDTSFYQGGTGIGLAMAQQIALDHQGQIAIKETSRGAQFDITLPRAPYFETQS